MRKNRDGIGGALLLVVFMVAACGGSDDDPGSSGGSGSSNSPPTNPCVDTSAPPECVKTLMVQTACTYRGYCFGCSTSQTPPATCAAQPDLTTSNGVQVLVEPGRYRDAWMKT
jgi:hypothetical protein